MRLLVAEDDAKLCEVLIRGLRGAGYNVDGAARWDVAFDLMMSNAYNAVVVDWRMPVMDGIQSDHDSGAQQHQGGEAAGAGRIPQRRRPERCR